MGILSDKPLLGNVLSERPRLLDTVLQQRARGFVQDSGSMVRTPEVKQALTVETIVGGLSGLASGLIGFTIRPLVEQRVKKLIG